MLESLFIRIVIMMAFPFIATASSIIRMRDPALAGFLLGRMPEIPTMGISVKGDLSDMDDSLDAICGFLEENGMSHESCERVRLCCEELATNASRHALGSDPDRSMDIVVHAGAEPSVIIRDDGPLFNPMTFDGEGIGLHVAKGMCKAMTYSRAMGQNNVRISFRR